MSDRLEIYLTIQGVIVLEAPRRVSIAGLVVRLSARMAGRWTRRPAGLLGLVLLGLTVVVGMLGSSAALASPPTTAIRYVYDADGHLKAVVNPASETALYGWDPAGNLTSIALKSSTKLSIIQLAPAQGAVGETVTISGTGFSTTASSDTVKFNGTAATVSAATALSLTVKVPTGATSGTVSVQTTTEGPVTSSQSFTVASSLAPKVTSLSATIASAGSEVTASGTNFETTVYNDLVAVNQTRPELLSESATSIKFKVPGATGSGHVYVATPQGSTTGPVLYIPPNGIATSKVGPTGTVSLGGSTTVKLTTAEKVGLEVFEGTAGQRVSLGLSESSIASGTVSIWGPEGSKVNGSSTGFGSGSAFMEPVTLPATGTYTILVEPSGSDTGNVKLSPYLVVDQTGSLVPTAEGASKAVSITTPGQRAVYTVAGTAGEQVSVKTSSTSFTGGLYWLEWFNPEGKGIAERHFEPTENAFMEQVKFATTGNYTLVVNPFGGHTGSTTLTAYNAADVTGTITPSEAGESKTVTIGVPGQHARITFSGKEGQRVSLGLSESTIASGSVSILNPEGVTVSGSGTSFSKEGFMEPVTLPSTGTYTILIEPWKEDTGSVKLSPYLVVDQTGSLVPTAEGASKAVSITTPGQRAVYTVAGTAGEQVSVKTSSTSFTGGLYWLEWFNPEGKGIAERHFEPTENAFMEQVKFATTGNYTLVVNPFGGHTGSTTLTAYNAADVTGTITPSEAGESKTVTIGVPGQHARITFSGKEGQRVSLGLSESTIASGSVSILNPEGVTVSGSGTSFSKEGFMEPVTLPSTGTYTILIEPWKEDTGSVKLSPYLVVDQTGSLVPTAEGASKAVSITTPGQRAVYTVAGTAGEQVSVKTSSTSFTGGLYWLEWFNPEGKGIAERHFEPTENAFMEQVKFATTGNYTLVVNPFGGHTGSTTLTAYNAADVTGTITPSEAGESKTVTIGVPGQHARITFSGKEGKTVTLKARESTIANGWMSVWNPEGVEVSGSEVNFSGEGASEEITPSVTGTYTILLEPWKEDTGSVKLTAYLGSHPGLVRRLASATSASRLARPKPGGAGLMLGGVAPILPPGTPGVAAGGTGAGTSSLGSAPVTAVQPVQVSNSTLLEFW